MKVINQTRQKQQINFVDGSSIMVYPCESANINIKKMYTDEFLRIKRFLKIEEIKKSPKKVIEEVKEVKISEEKPLEKNGGKK